MKLMLTPPLFIAALLSGMFFYSDIHPNLFGKEKTEALTLYHLSEKPTPPSYIQHDWNFTYIQHTWDSIQHAGNDFIARFKELAILKW